MAKNTKKGMDKLRRHKDLDEPILQGLELSDRDMAVQPEPEPEDPNVWNIHMNSTWEFLLHDTTIAIFVCASVLVIPTFRNFSILMQGHVPASVHLSWLVLAFAVGQEIGRAKGLRAVPGIPPSEGPDDGTMSKVTTTSHVPTETSFATKMPAPKQGYALFYYLTPYKRIRIIFPKETANKVAEASKQHITKVGNIWSTLGASDIRGRQAWEVGGFVKVADPLMNRLLNKPSMQRKQLKTIMVAEHEASLSDSGHVPATVLGDIRINEMPAESLENKVIDPRFKLRGMDVFLTEAAEEDMYSHPFLLKNGLRDKPTFMVNAIVQWANICLYFELPDWFTDFDDIVEHDDDPPDIKAIKLFLLGDDAYRNARLKILPCLVDGPLPIKIMAPPKKELTVSCASLPSKWKFHNKTTLEDGTVLHPVLEMEIDVISNSAIRSISAMLKRYIKMIALDLALVIQTPDGQTKQEPEACLGLWRFDHIDIMTCPPLPQRVERQDVHRASQFVHLSEEELAAMKEETVSAF